MNSLDGGAVAGRANAEPICSLAEASWNPSLDRCRYLELKCCIKRTNSSKMQRSGDEGGRALKISEEKLCRRHRVMSMCCIHMNGGSQGFVRASTGSSLEQAPRTVSSGDLEPTTRVHGLHLPPLHSLARYGAALTRPS